ncbi:MAG: helix-turn-helix domain-containing protein [Solirubrobacteraceae bacterium]
MSRNDLLSVAETAGALGATGQSVRNWIRSGRLAAVRIGARFSIPCVEVERRRGALPGPAAGESPCTYRECHLMWIGAAGMFLSLPFLSVRAPRPATSTAPAPDREDLS